MDHDLPGLVPVRRIGEDRGAFGPRQGQSDQGPHDEVYLAIRVADGAEVAVRVYGKALLRERDRERFVRELDAIRGLVGEPYILPIYDAGVTSAGRPYVVMEFCQSGSLRDHVRTVGRLTPAEACRVGVKLCAAATAMHRRNLVHRAIRPANVLVTAAGEPALANFGLATLATADGDFAPPTPSSPRPFVAPEALLPELMTPAAGIFALGATLYALLAGHPPRSADPLAVTIDGDTLADLPKVPFALMSVIRRAMAVDPRDRYATADELAQALTELG